MTSRLDELCLSKDYIAKAFGVTPEIIAAIEKGVEQITKEQADKLEFFIGARTLSYDDSDEAEIERLKKLREDKVNDYSK